MKPHGSRFRRKIQAAATPNRPSQVAPSGEAPQPRPMSPPTAPENSRAEETLQQLEEIVGEFMERYPSHTQRVPSLRPGEHPLIGFVRSMAASMAAKQENLEKLNAEVVEAANEK